MILGTVNPDRREAYIRLFVHSPSGAIQEIEAVVDTGYTEELPGEGSPLVGISLLLEHLLTVPVTAGGVLRIEPVP